METINSAKGNSESDIMNMIKQMVDKKMADSLIKPDAKTPVKKEDSSDSSSSDSEEEEEKQVPPSPHNEPAAEPIAEKKKKIGKRKADTQPDISPPVQKKAKLANGASKAVDTKK